MKKIIFCLLSVLGLMVMVNSCKKPPTTIVTPTPAGLGSNVHIIDTAQWIQNMNHPDRISAGLFDYTFTPNTPYINIKVGDIIVGTTGEGYLRKVGAVIVNNNGLTLQTSQATLNDLFKGGTYSFDMDLSGMNNSPVGFYDSFNNVVFYQNGSQTSERLVNGSFSMNPSWHFNFAFDTNGLTNFGLTTTNASYSSNYTLKLNASQALSFQNKVVKLGDYSKTAIQWITVGDVKVPVVATMEVTLTATATGLVIDAGNSQETFASSGSFNNGVSYSGGAWQNNYSLSPANTLAVAPLLTGSSYSANVSVVPKVNFKLYGVSCAYSSVSMASSFNSKLYWQQGDWNYYANGWLNSATGAVVGIYGPHVPAYSQTWSTDTVNYQTPVTAVQASGEGQSGAVTTALANKLIARVLDSNGNPQQGVPVYFTPATSCGTLNPAKVLTDANGYAATTWTLGTVHGSQSVNAVIKNGANAPITTVTFTATGF